jgi:hypothetical protein
MGKAKTSGAPKKRTVVPKSQRNAGGNGVAPGQARLDLIGIDALCAKVADGVPMIEIAAEAQVSFGTLQTWIEAVPERSARMREVRRQASRMWDERALQGIERASDPFELAKAKEAAHHLRWRASKIAPADYGERISAELTGKDGGPIQTRNLDDETLKARIAELTAKFSATNRP